MGWKGFEEHVINLSKHLKMYASPVSDRLDEV
jgi:hypothetical protein